MLCTVGLQYGIQAGFAAAPQTVAFVDVGSSGTRVSVIQYVEQPVPANARKDAKPVSTSLVWACVLSARMTGWGMV